MVKLSELRKFAIDYMLKNGIEEARADTDFLLFFLVGADKNDILLGDKMIEKEKEDTFLKALKRRAGGEPVQYIAGRTGFMSLKFFVDSSTLIPRADTEILAEKCIKLIADNSLKTVLDIGTGSGCIGLSLAYYLKDISVTLLDVSEAALKIAEKNASALKLSDRVNFLQADILTAKELTRSFDLVVSNPPYIKTKVLSKLDKKITSFEPLSALDGGADGLLFYRKITHLAAEKASYLAFEIGFDQSTAVESIMAEYFSDIEVLKDYGGNFRVLTGKNKQI